MDPRPLTERERAVLEALLAVEFRGAEVLRRQAAEVMVIGMCGCGCPSIDFRSTHGRGMAVRVNAATPDHDGLFLYTVEGFEGTEALGGIEWVGVGGTDPDEFPPPSLLRIEPL
ncbi:hypothetical protein [Saccharothrix australiensis]|uniref:Uncharacterized protein n=1 Tax=Saccharothrix australiensis TaxID=2072 RepID=A0A495VWB7_9PSEU|nr:hypothetical protein [Saccharothrix australiensis]RKT53652.1 hypothetical protein C8E97_2226 [Saccharothrix australiensis]